MQKQLVASCIGKQLACGDALLQSDYHIAEWHATRSKTVFAAGAVPLQKLAYVRVLRLQ